MSDTKYTLFVTDEEHFPSKKEFLAAVGSKHEHVYEYEFTVPSNLQPHLVRLIANGMLLDNDWCNGGIYTELRSEPPAEPEFDVEAAARELYVLGATARAFDLELNDCIDAQWLQEDFLNHDKVFWQRATTVQNQLKNKACPRRADINEIVRVKTLFVDIVAKFRTMPLDELIHRYTTKDFTGPFVRPEP